MLKFLNTYFNLKNNCNLAVFKVSLKYTYMRYQVFKTWFIHKYLKLNGSKNKKYQSFRIIVKKICCSKYRTVIIEQTPNLVKNIEQTPNLVKIIEQTPNLVKTGWVTTKPYTMITLSTTTTAQQATLCPPRRRLAWRNRWRRRRRRRRRSSWRTDGRMMKLKGRNCKYLNMFSTVERYKFHLLQLENCHFSVVIVSSTC